MSEAAYCKKTFLTDSPEPSTSAIVCFYGDIKWSKAENGDNVSFIEVCNCHEKARLHRTFEMSHEEWVNQVKRLMGEVAEYLAFLEDQSNAQISGGTTSAESDCSGDAE